jgi:tRNA-specific 2-thiouridylase
MTRLAERRLHIAFDEPQFAVTPGQAVVCYDADNNERVLGGGWIE